MQLAFDSQVINGGAKRITGDLYSQHEDFVVREISLNGNCEDDFFVNNLNKIVGGKRDFVECTLVKKNISTFSAVLNLANFLNIPAEEIGYAGLKDTFGITVQRISIPSKTFIKNLCNNKIFTHKLK